MDIVLPVKKQGHAYYHQRDEWIDLSNLEVERNQHGATSITISVTPAATCCPDRDKKGNCPQAVAKPERLLLKEGRALQKPASGTTTLYRHYRRFGTDLARLPRGSQTHPL